MSTSDYPLHLQELERLLATNPRNCEVRERLGRELVELGHQEVGFGHLCASAELRAERDEFREAVSLLNEILKLSPEHAKAKKMLPKFYARVPRQPTAKLRVPSLPDEPMGLDSMAAPEYGAEFFALPEESVAVLSQLLPFAEEDPSTLHGDIEVPLLQEAYDSSLPLLSALDRELGTDDLLPTGDHLSVAAFDDDPEIILDEAFLSEDESVLVSPASRELTINEMPPNPIIGLLDSEPLAALLDRSDLIKLSANESFTPKRSLYVVIRGQFELLTYDDLNSHVTLQVLEPGDFFGEFGLLANHEDGPRVLALKASSILEIPGRLVDELASESPATRELLREVYHSRAFRMVMARSPLFSQVPSDIVTRISVELEPLRFQAGDIIFKSGETPQGLYIVVSGNLAVVSLGGNTNVITRLSSEEFFSEVEASDAFTEPSAVVATEDCTMLWLPPWSFVPLRETLPAFSRALREATPSTAWPHKLVERQPQLIDPLAP